MNYRDADTAMRCVLMPSLCLRCPSLLNEDQERGNPRESGRSEAAQDVMKGVTG